jgi:hypothetical protein
VENALFYTFSTISQTLAGAIALLGAFVLYRLQTLNAGLQQNAAIARTHIRGNSNQHSLMMDYELQGRYDEVLQVCLQANQETPVEFTAARSQLAELLARRTSLYRSFRWSLLLTVSLVGVSVALLAFTPRIASTGYAEVVLALGTIWFLSCLWAYSALLVGQVKRRGR